MKPIRLDLDGFGTFRDPATLDFSDTDYFALVGPTGAGKTTVIDGLCFALYGTVPRWQRKGEIRLAMAPSVNHTRVALVFDTGGARYAAVRVLARSSKGQVSTREARLVQLPADADVAGDIGDVLDQAAADLAVTPDTVTDTVARLLGLPWEHFIQCVVLPQGEFQKFLHAAPRERQEVLVSLLGLDVYDKVAALARQNAQALTGKEEMLRGQLDRYADATEHAEDEAAKRLRRLKALQRGLPQQTKQITAAQEKLNETRAQANQLQTQLDALTAVRRPQGLDTLLGRHQAAQSARDTAAEQVSTAEQAEEAAAAAAEQTGPPYQWQQLVEHHQRHQQLLVDADTATQRLRDLVTAFDDAAQKAADADNQRQAASEALEAARTQHAAADLAQHLHVGQDCPVCLQQVTQLPDRPPLAELAKAQKDLQAAERLVKQAHAAHTDATVAHTRGEELAERLRTEAEQLAQKLTDQPDLPQAQELLRQAADAEQTAKKAAGARRSLQQELRAAEKKLADVAAEIDTARTHFGAARDPLVAYGAPAPTGKLAADWDTLLTWAIKLADTVHEQLGDARDAQQQAEQQLAQLVDDLTERLRVHDVPVRAKTEPDEFAALVATAVSDAAHALERVKERRAQAADLARQALQAGADAALHRELGVQLDARHFERWLVEEALELLVADASETLLELSGGQFQLYLADKNAIVIVDHNDAGSHRPVSTLSGGETFQAALSLALALSRRTAALSAIPTRDLDTILLDEGFGTLDAATLDTVASTLENLSGGGEHTVGVVTHVPALADRTHVRFAVTRHGNHSTVTKVVGP